MRSLILGSLVLAVAACGSGKTAASLGLGYQRFGSSTGVPQECSSRRIRGLRRDAMHGQVDLPSRRKRLWPLRVSHDHDLWFGHHAGSTTGGSGTSGGQTRCACGRTGSTGGSGTGGAASSGTTTGAPRIGQACGSTMDKLSGFAVLLSARTAASGFLHHSLRRGSVRAPRRWPPALRRYPRPRRHAQLYPHLLHDQLGRRPDLLLRPGMRNREHGGRRNLPALFDVHRGHLPVSGTCPLWARARWPVSNVEKGRGRKCVRIDLAHIVLAMEMALAWQQRKLRFHERRGNDDRGLGRDRHLHRRRHGRQRGRLLHRDQQRWHAHHRHAHRPDLRLDACLQRLTGLRERRQRQSRVFCTTRVRGMTAAGAKMPPSGGPQLCAEVSTEGGTPACDLTAKNSSGSLTWSCGLECGNGRQHQLWRRVQPGWTCSSMNICQ